MGTEIKSREELMDEIAYALQERYEYIDAFNYIDIANQLVRISVDDITVCDELFPKDGEAIVRIEPLESRESFGCMEDFADQVTDKRKQEHLYRALNRRHPFSNFRYAVEDTGLLQDWYNFRDEWYKDKAKEWMDDNDVDFKDGRITAKNPEMFHRDDETDEWD